MLLYFSIFFYPQPFFFLKEKLFHFLLKIQIKKKKNYVKPMKVKRSIFFSHFKC